MSAGTPEAELPQELVDRALKLPADSREKFALLLLDSLDGPPDDPDGVGRAWQAELQRRVDAVRDGTMKTYSLEETMAYLRQRLAEGPAS